MAVNLGKAKNTLSKTWSENVRDINEDEAANMIVRAEQKIRDILDEQQADDKLNAAKQIVKDLNAGYSSIVSLEKAKIRHLLERVQEIQDGEVNKAASVWWRRAHDVSLKKKNPLLAKTSIAMTV